MCNCVRPMREVAQTPRFDEAVRRIRAWGEARDWRGYDPYDALNSPLAPFVTLGRPFARRALTQLVKRSPVNLRPVLRVPAAHNAKAIALVASGYAHLAALGDASAAIEARRWLGWLVGDGSDGAGLAWGYHFDVQTRFFGYARGTPNAIASSFAGHALLDGYELLGDARWGDAARSAASELVRRFFRDASRPYFGYLPREDELVHNANLLCCSVLARTSRAVDAPELADVVRAALPASLEAQRDDGAWPYAEGPGHDWVDNFHTGYVLESLCHCASVDPTVEPHLRRGIDFWSRELFLADGTPKYDTAHVYPLDAHCYATAVDTLVAMQPHHAGALTRARQVADLLISRMLHPSGYIRFQQHRRFTNNVPYVRWTTAPSFRALARLLHA